MRDLFKGIFLRLIDHQFNGSRNIWYACLHSLRGGTQHLCLCWRHLVHNWKKKINKGMMLGTGSSNQNPHPVIKKIGITIKAWDDSSSEVKSEHKRHGHTHSSSHFYHMCLVAWGNTSENDIGTNNDDENPLTTNLQKMSNYLIRSALISTETN